MNPNTKFKQGTEVIVKQDGKVVKCVVDRHLTQNIYKTIKPDGKSLYAEAKNMREAKEEA